MMSESFWLAIMILGLNIAMVLRDRRQSATLDAMRTKLEDRLDRPLLPERSAIDVHRGVRDDSAVTVGGDGSTANQAPSSAGEAQQPNAALKRTLDAAAARYIDWQTPRLGVKVLGNRPPSREPPEGPPQTTFSGITPGESESDSAAKALVMERFATMTKGDSDMDRDRESADGNFSLMS